MQGRCKQHGLVEGIEDRRGRLRCPVDGCRKLLATRLSDSPVPAVGSLVATEVLPPGDLSLDVDIREHHKALVLVNYQRAIREAQKPTTWEAELAEVKAYVEALGTQFEGFQDSLAVALQAIENRLDDLGGELNRTPLHGFSDKFKCSCGSAGYLAVYVKCTSCMKEEWYGNWPKEVGVPAIE